MNSTTLTLCIFSQSAKNLKYLIIFLSLILSQKFKLKIVNRKWSNHVLHVLRQTCVLQITKKTIHLLRMCWTKNLLASLLRGSIALINWVTEPYKRKILTVYTHPVFLIAYGLWVWATALQAPVVISISRSDWKFLNYEVWKQ